MTELLEGVQPPAVEQAEAKKEKKQPVKIRCSLFFDGTCNNRNNTDARTGKLDAEGKSNRDKYEANKAQKAAEELKKKDALSGKGDASYENDYTNIATLEPAVWPEASEGNQYFIKVYTEGPGTVINYGRDNSRGYAFGSGDEAGVKSKVLSGIIEAVSKIQGIDDIKPNKKYIEKLELDVFGFSRGAAGARYCIHQLIIDENMPIKKRLELLGFEVHSVEMCFAGLFDTVASYNLGQMTHTDNWVLKLKSVKHAKAVLHLAAAEEYRSNFPLHNIDSAGGKGKQYFLPGVHSDVGGSYCDNESDAGKVVSRGLYSHVKGDTKNLIEQGWYTNSDLTLTVLTKNDVGDPEFVKVTANGRTVRNAYCNIPLKIMAKHTKENGIKLIDELESVATEKISSFSELIVLEAAIQSYIGKAGNNSKPSDWQGKNPQPLGISTPPMNEIRYKHLHMSANYDSPEAGGLVYPLAPRFGWFSNKRKRYEFNG